MKKERLKQSICVREMKKRRDISRFCATNPKSIECSSCCKNSENLHYAVNYNPSRNVNSYSNYFNKTNNFDFYNDLNYKAYGDQQNRYRTKYVHCPGRLKSADKFLTTCDDRNVNYSKTIENIVCTNKNFDLSQGEEPSEQNKSFCLRNRDDSLKYNKELTNVIDKNYCSDDQRVVKFSSRIGDKFENNVFDAYSPFKISIQCYERGMHNKQKIVNEAANQETQTALELKQQGISTDVKNYLSKEIQCTGIATQSRQTGIDDEDHLKMGIIPKKSVCVSCDQTDEIKDDYFLLMPGGKCVKLAQKIFTNENFVPCPGANNDGIYDDESFSICTETSNTTQESRMVDSNTMTTPELLECVEKILRNDSQVEIQENFDSQVSRNEEINDNESKCRICKTNQVVDENLKFCFEKLFNKKLSNSDCFPCLNEKLNKTGDLTKRILYILKYALELNSNAKNNTNDSRFNSKNTNEIIKKLCKCVKKLSNPEILKQTKSKNSTLSQNKENNKVSKIMSTEEEEEQEVENFHENLKIVQKNVGIEKQTETDNRPITTRSMNTFIEEFPVEIIQTLLESEGTNTEFRIHKEIGTNTIEKKRSQDASTQSYSKEKCINNNNNNKKIKMTNQCREPILVRVISSSDGQKAQFSEYSTSESDDFRKIGFKRVCFNDNSQFQVFKKDLKNCEENCSNKELTKIRDKTNYKVKKKIDKKCMENSRIRNLGNRKIFYNDFFD
ncbi:uncharacterized protein LOC127285084 isoform X2 [Leptopilina boulardi]|uniref:uncharacterized protein LOC127285084 isoform X2 n=1 Tax=Leptopilina boulardi TaxID=63433 RepID=UPI0021F62A46|nr:uncharacterized protein LOC127285084 isoform X2 [Leptopilina boulardi]